MCCMEAVSYTHLYKSVLEILNIYQAVGDMHFIGERDYFNKIAEKLKKELGTDQ